MRNLIRDADADELTLTLAANSIEFVKLRETLQQQRLPGAAGLPPLPSKTLLFSAGAADVEKRLNAFNAMLKHVGAHDTLATADAVVEFFSGASARCASFEFAL